ncbi:MAG: acyl-CoA dehydrogenase family protein [Thermodesulfobacteriota bacterium]|nr:acyl-CoA dehydrogenase family protein [Thermodesulfobacteriota bacterium]
MDFGLNEEQEILKKTAHNLLTKECPASFVKEIIKDEKGYSPELWKKMAELGWMSLIFPEQYGGMGGCFLDLAILLEEMGSVCLPSPFFSTIILGGLSILEGGSDKQKEEILPSIAEGKSIITLAITEPSAKYTPDGIEVRATKADDGYILEGTKLFVPDAHIANYIVVVARTTEGTGADGITLFILDSKTTGLSCSPLLTIAGDKQFEVTFDNVSVSKDSILGAIDNGWSVIEAIWPRIIVAKCAEMVGGAQKSLEMTVNYAKERKQFGRPIGALQAIQHFCADMVSDVDACRYITYMAAWTISKGVLATKEASMAKAWCSDAFRRVTTTGQQVHGAIGFTEEHDLHLYYKNAKSWELLFGDRDAHREIVAKQMGF